MRGNTEKSVLPLFLSLVTLLSGWYFSAFQNYIAVIDLFFIFGIIMNQFLISGNVVNLTTTNFGGNVSIPNIR